MGFMSSSKNGSSYMVDHIDDNNNDLTRNIRKIEKYIYLVSDSSSWPGWKK